MITNLKHIVDDMLELKREKSIQESTIISSQQQLWELEKFPGVKSFSFPFNVFLSIDTRLMAHLFSNCFHIRPVNN